MKTALITGVTGQDGAYLSKLLLEKGYTVYGGVRRSATLSTGRLDELGITADVQFCDLDLLEFTNVLRLVEKVRPDEIYNLAAQSFVGTSFEQPFFTTEVNALGVLRLLDAVRTIGGGIRFYQASTSEMFGKVTQVPQNEETPYHPRSPYGVAKLYAHWITTNYREAHNLFATSGVLFNHESPLRGREFVTRKISLNLAAIKLGQAQVLSLGNLDAKRDWGYAADYVEGMWLMLQHHAADTFVLATGQTHTVREFVEMAARHLGFKLMWEGQGVNEIGVDVVSGKTIVQIDPRFYRPAEVDLLLGSYEKANRELKWRPKTSLEGLVEMMVKADLDRRESGKILF